MTKFLYLSVLNILFIERISNLSRNVESSRCQKYLFCTQFLRSKGYDFHYLLLVRQCHLYVTLSRVLSYSWHRPWSDRKKNPIKILRIGSSVI